MTPSEIADRLVAEPASARRLLSAHSGTPGVSQAFMVHVLRLFGADQASLIRLQPVARLIARHGDDPALGHRSLAIVHRVRGRWADSAREFLAAGDAAESPRDRLAFKTGAIDSLARAGRAEEAIALAGSLKDGLEAIGEHGLAARVAMNLGYALMEQDRYAEAWRLLEGLAQRLLDAGYSMEAASARVALCSSHLFGGSVVRAREEAQAAIAMAEAEEMDFVGDVARGNLALADLLCGDADLAVDTLLRLRERHDVEAAERARTMEYLGDAYAAMNLWTEAEDAYREALAAKSLTFLGETHLHLGLGQVLLAAGKPAAAQVELAKATRRYLRLGNHAWASAAQTDRGIAEGLMGRRSGRRLESAIDLARRSESPFHLCRALLAAAEGGGSEALLSEASDILRRHPYPRLQWRVEAERARRTGGTARLRHYRQMFRAILREQARTSSFASRVGFLRDKAQALQGYLDELLARPTAARVREAVSVVAQSRSVTLLDELLQGRDQELPQEVRVRLENLRATLSDDTSESPSGGSRRHGAGAHGLDRAQRQWMEETYSLARLTDRPTAEIAAGSVVLLESPRGLRAVSNRMRQLVDRPADVDERLRWLSYDLLAPMADRDAPGGRVLRDLQELGERLVLPLLDVSGTVGVCPDGLLWRVPWLACLDALGAERDLEIRIHPGLMGRDAELTRHAPMLWVAEHPDLPWAVRESEAFIARFPGATVCRSAEEVKACLAGGRASVLHVVTHASHRSSHPMFSSLDFVDGPVLAAEIARSGLRADLVTLSGCDTGRLSDVNRLEPDGLVRAFLACGAGYVVGSAWPLDDEAAVRLYDSFFSQLVEGSNTHVALRKARKDVREWRGHPYFWASPLLYGGYRT